jgi:regulator of protease activity HflC (stomatin/prohibitin superfamily)
VDAVFGWLGELVQWVADWIPRVEICRKNHGGVKFVRGEKVVEVHPGLYVYWPVTTEVELIPKARQTLTVGARLTTKDGVTVSVTFVVVYEVADVVKAIVSTWDHDQTISDVALSVGVNSVLSRDFEEVRAGILDGTVPDELKKECRSELSSFGLRILKADVTDFAETSVVSYVGDLPLPEMRDRRG